MTAVIASAAKQSRLGAPAILDCFAALAMITLLAVHAFTRYQPAYHITKRPDP